MAKSGDTHRNTLLKKGCGAVNANQMKHAANLSAWKERIIECRASGLSVRAWCEQNACTPSTYYRWEREIFGRIKKPTLSEPGAEVSNEYLVPIRSQTMVELPIAESDSLPQQTTANTSAFRPAAVVRNGELELSLTNAVSPRLMKQLKEWILHVE